MLIEGIPEGCEVVRIGIPKKGEKYLSGGIVCTVLDASHILPQIIVQRTLPTPETYRPFKDAAEWWPHRDMWLVHKDDTTNLGNAFVCKCTPTDFNNWFQTFVFVTSPTTTTPFGVKV